MKKLFNLCCVLFFVVSAVAADSKPNVLFIAIDDLNDWVGFLGGHPQVKTPNMDRLAKRGVVFANAHCAAPLCCPSRAAVFSGKQPFNSGVYQNKHAIRNIRPDLVLIPQHFGAKGYRTFGTGKLLHRKRSDLFDETFFTEQRWSPFTRKQVEYSPEELLSKGTTGPRHVLDWRSSRPKVVLPLNGMPSDRAPNEPKGESFDWGAIEVSDDAMGDGQVAQWAAARLKQRHDQPFFLAIGFYRPHIPLFAPAKHFEPYPVDSIQLPESHGKDLEDLSEIARTIAIEPVTAGRHSTVLKYEQWEEAVAAYLACVTFVDAQVGRLLAALEKGPNSENTIIVLWSDHGWHLGEKQHWGKWTGWERSTRVPLLIAPTKRSAQDYELGEVCSQPVSLIDLYPTMIELCGLEAPKGLDGVSLVSHLQDPEKPSARAVVTTFDTDHFSVRDRRWRWIRYRDGSEELYDHETDPLETVNLIHDSQFAPHRARLSLQLAEEKERTRAQSGLVR